MDAVRDWVGDFEIGKGRPYAENAVFGCQRDDGNGDLIAYVRGTRVRPYMVNVRVGARWNNSADGTVRHAFCQCPVGAGGKCKHVAAVLLAYVEDPARFPDTTLAESAPGEKSREELLELVLQLLRFAPELKPLVVLPVPGFVSGEVSPELFRGLAVEVVRAARSHDEHAEKDVVEQFWPLLWLGWNYKSRGDEQAAEAVTEALTRALRESGLNRDRLQKTMDESSAAGFWKEVRQRLTLDEPAGENLPPF
jgi:uncharacterized Zn finger protein